MGQDLEAVEEPDREDRLQQRAGQAEDEEQGRDVADQQVLAHVGDDELLGDVADRAEEGDRDHRQAGPEADLAPGRDRPAVPVQDHRSVPVEDSRERLSGSPRSGRRLRRHGQTARSRNSAYRRDCRRRRPRPLVAWPRSELPRRALSRRSAAMDSCPTATPVRWCPTTARSSGSACRASTRRACSERSSIAAPATSSSAPRGVVVPISRRYEPGTLVIETTWVTDTGWVVVHDAMTIGDWAEPGPRSRPRAQHEADHSLLRLMTCIDGEVDIDMECAPQIRLRGRGRRVDRRRARRGDRPRALTKPSCD